MLHLIMEFSKKIGNNNEFKFYINFILILYSNFKLFLRRHLGDISRAIK